MSSCPLPMVFLHRRPSLRRQLEGVYLLGVDDDDADRVRVAAHSRVPLETRASRDVHRYRFRVKSRGVVYLVSNGDDHVVSHADDVVRVSTPWPRHSRRRYGLRWRLWHRRVRDETTIIGGKDDVPLFGPRTKDRIARVFTISGSLTTQIHFQSLRAR